MWDSAAGRVSSSVTLTATLLFWQGTIVKIRPLTFTNLQAAQLMTELLKGTRGNAAIIYIDAFSSKGLMKPYCTFVVTLLVSKESSGASRWTYGPTLLWQSWYRTCSLPLIHQIRSNVHDLYPLTRLPSSEQSEFYAISSLQLVHLKLDSPTERANVGLCS